MNLLSIRSFAFTLPSWIAIGGILWNTLLFNSPQLLALTIRLGGRKMNSREGDGYGGNGLHIKPQQHKNTCKCLITHSKQDQQNHYQNYSSRHSCIHFSCFFSDFLTRIRRYSIWMGRFYSHAAKTRRCIQRNGIYFTYCTTERDFFSKLSDIILCCASSC